MRNLYLFLLLLFFFLSGLSAADTTYYYGNNKRPLDSDKDALLKVTVKQRSQKVFLVKTYLKSSGEWKENSNEKYKFTGPATIRIRNRDQSLLKKTKERIFAPDPEAGYSFREYQGDLLIREGKSGQLMPLHLEDTVKTYYDNGNIKSIAYYQNNQLQNNMNWLPDGTKYINDLYFFLKKSPEFSLGNTMFNSYILNGLKAAKIDFSQINDEIIIGWVIMEDGNLEGLQMVSGKITALGQLIMDLIREMPGKWIPAQYEGHAVRYYMEVPFNFKVNVNSLESLELRNGLLIYN